MNEQLTEQEKLFIASAIGMITLQRGEEVYRLMFSIAKKLGIEKHMIESMDIFLTREKEKKEGNT